MIAVRHRVGRALRSAQQRHLGGDGIAQRDGRAPEEERHLRIVLSASAAAPCAHRNASSASPCGQRALRGLRAQRKLCVERQGRDRRQPSGHQLAPGDRVLRVAEGARECFVRVARRRVVARAHEQLRGARLGPRVVRELRCSARAAVPIADPSAPKRAPARASHAGSMTIQPPLARAAPSHARASNVASSEPKGASSDRGHARATSPRARAAARRRR